MTSSPRIGPGTTFLPGGLQPFLLRTGSGRLFVTAQLPVPAGTPFPGVWGAAVSDDDGKTWREWRRPNVPGGSPFFEGCAAPLRDGTTLLLEWSARGPHPGGRWLARRWESGDNWESIRGPLEAWTDVPQARGGFDDDGHPAGEVFLHRSLLELPSGSILCTAYGWFEGDDTPSTYRPQMNKLRSLLLRSDDRGATWRYVSTIAVDPSVGEEGFNEPAMVRVSAGPRAGRLIVLLRTGSNKTFRRNPLYQTYSDDEGRTWSTPRPLGLAGNVDPEIIELRSGVLAAAYGWRTFESRVNLTSEPKTIGVGHGNYLALSYDQGDTWTRETRVTDAPSTCYPCLCEIAPGRLLMVYDIGDAWQHVWADHPGIERSLGCREIDVSRGECSRCDEAVFATDELR